MANKLQNDLLCVYVLIGTDKLKANTVLDRLEKRLEEYGDMSLNSSSFDGQTAVGTDIVAACMQMPFASEKRSVIVRNADKLRKDDTERIIEYLEKPNNSTVLTLICSKLAKSTRLYKAAQKISNTSIIDCTAPKKYQVAETLNKVARSHGGSIGLDAAKLLVEYVGEDTLKLDAEIQKLLLSNGGADISKIQIMQEVKKTAEVKPWDFTNAFAARDLNTCLTLFKEMPEGTEYQLLPQTCRMVKELIAVHDLGEGATQNAISQILGYES